MNPRVLAFVMMRIGSVCPSVSACLCLSLSVSVCLCLSLSVSVCLCLSDLLPVYQSLCLPVSMSIIASRVIALRTMTQLESCQIMFLKYGIRCILLCRETVQVHKATKVICFNLTSISSDTSCILKSIYRA